MNPKTITAALTVLSIAHAHAGEAVTLTWKKDAPENAQTAVLTLAAGESAKVKWGSSGGAGETFGLNDRAAVAQVLFTIAGETRAAALFARHPDNNFSGTTYTLIPFEIAGPASIALRPIDESTQTQAIATFEVTRAASPSVTPSNAAVIPVDANGTFTVILESSTDLITWTAANPGDYSGNTVKRFFRTRIVKK
jgi:hypothetical protein